MRTEHFQSDIETLAKVYDPAGRRGGAKRQWSA